MSRGLSRLAVLLPLAAIVVGSACADVIDLGPEATLRAESGGAGGAGEGEGGGAGAPPVRDCGPLSEGAPTCTACMTAQCCDELIACGESDRCSAGSRELRVCTFDFACIADVTTRYEDTPELGVFLGCITRCTTECTPSGECAKLAPCCQAADGLAAEACQVVIETEDDTRCREARETTFAAFCPE